MAFGEAIREWRGGVGGFARGCDPAAGARPAPHTLAPMSVLLHFFLGLHIIGIAALLGGFLTQMKAMGRGEARIVPAMLHGALTMLVTGMAMVGISEAQHHSVNTIKIGVKLAFLIVILGLVYVKRDEETVEKGVIATVGGLTMANIFIAVLWS
jgi:hypothetical protein